MNPDVPLQLMHEGLTMLVVVGGPILIILAVMGTLVGVLQAATQINDPAVGFLPRIVALGMGLWLLGPWMLERLGSWLALMLGNMAGRGP